VTSVHVRGVCLGPAGISSLGGQGGEGKFCACYYGDSYFQSRGHAGRVKASDRDYGGMVKVNGHPCAGGMVMVSASDRGAYSLAWSAGIDMMSRARYRCSRMPHLSRSLC
jgi:hypothetical protein